MAATSTDETTPKGLWNKRLKTPQQEKRTIFEDNQIFYLRRPAIFESLLGSCFHSLFCASFMPINTYLGLSLDALARYKCAERLSRIILYESILFLCVL